MVRSIPRTRAEELAAAVEEDVRSRNLQPGDYFGNMDELREQTGFARSTISETVRLLRDRGTIEIRPGRNGGLFVAALDPVVRLRHTLLTVGHGAVAVADAIVVRELLEPQVNLDAAAHRSEADIADLRRLLAELERASDAEGFLRANMALHNRIAEITPNTVLKGVYLAMTHSLAEMPRRVEPEADSYPAGYMAERIRIHGELVEAIAEGDVDRTREVAARHAGDRVQASRDVVSA